MKQSDREASNAIVAQAAFYAGALRRADAKLEERDRVIEVLRADKVKQDAELAKEREDRERLRIEVNQLRADLGQTRSALQAEGARTNEAQREITHLKDKFAQAEERLRTVDRALIESHNERDGLRKKLHENGEALGFLKGQANVFMTKLRGRLTSSGYTIETADDVLEAIEDLISRAGPVPAGQAPKHRRLKP